MKRYKHFPWSISFEETETFDKSLVFVLHANYFNITFSSTCWMLLVKKLVVIGRAATTM